MKLLRVSLDGECEAVCEIPGVGSGLGFLPNGDVVITSMFDHKLLTFANGKVSTLCDLSKVAAGTIDDMIIKWPPPAPEEIRDSREEIERSGLFEDVRIARRVWEEEFTADEYVAMMGTASDHVLMELEKRERLFSEMRRLIGVRPGSRVRRHWLTILHVARRR